MNKVSVWFFGQSYEELYPYPMVMVRRTKQRYYYQVSPSSLRRLVNLITGRTTIRYDGWSVESEAVK